MISRMLMLDTEEPARAIRRQLQETADVIVRRMEEHIAHLEFLLDEADAKSAALDQKLQEVEERLTLCRSLLEDQSKWLESLRQSGAGQNGR